VRETVPTETRGESSGQKQLVERGCLNIKGRMPASCGEREGIEIAMPIVQLLHLVDRDNTATHGDGTQGRITVTFRFGTCPTGMRVTSFSAMRSMTDTEFDPALAT